MKMMMISSLVETGGWGTPLIPVGGNTVIKVVGVEVLKVVMVVGVKASDKSVSLLVESIIP